MANNQDIRPWHRQPKETPKAYAAFEIFLNMREQRTLTKVCQTLKKTLQHVQAWSVLYDWDTRSRAFDNHERMIADAARSAAQAEMIHKREKLWQKRREEIRNKEFELGGEIIEVGKQHLSRWVDLLKFPVVETKEEGAKVTLADGTESTQTIINKPLTGRVIDPIKAISEGLKLQRQAAEMPTESVIVNQSQTPTLKDDIESTDDISKMSLEDIEAELEKINQLELEVKERMAEAQKAALAQQQTELEANHDGND